MEPAAAGSVAEESLTALVAILGGTLATATTVALGYLHRRVHELRDRMRDLEGELATLQPIIEAARKASSKELVALIRGGRRRV